MAPKVAAVEKTYSTETIKALFAALHKRGVIIGNADYAIMAQITGTTSSSAYEHQFREMKRQAAEISKGLDGNVATPKSGKASKTTTPGTGTDKKRGRKTDADAEAEAEDDQEEVTPVKKAKGKKVKKEELADTEEAGLDYPAKEGCLSIFGGSTSHFDDAN